MMETQFLHLLMSNKSEPICQYVNSCLQQMQRADLVNVFEQDSCENPHCQIHIKKADTEEEYYEQGPGLCVIINQKIFYADPSHPHTHRLEDRLGTDRDRDELEATFTLFGTDCLIFNDLTHEEMLDKLELAALKANNQKYSWVSVCVLSHGRRLNGTDEILGCNGIGIDRKKVVELQKLRCFHPLIPFDNSVDNQFLTNYSKLIKILHSDHQHVC